MFKPNMTYLLRTMACYIFLSHHAKLLTLHVFALHSRSCFLQYIYIATHPLSMVPCLPRIISSRTPLKYTCLRVTVNLQVMKHSSSSGLPSSPDISDPKAEPTVEPSNKPRAGNPIQVADPHSAQCLPNTHVWKARSPMARLTSQRVLRESLAHSKPNASKY